MLDRTDKQLIWHALGMWANYIETNDVTLSAIDAQNMKLPFRALDVSQMEMVVRLRKLAAKELISAYD